MTFFSTVGAKRTQMFFPRRCLWIKQNGESFFTQFRYFSVCSSHIISPELTLWCVTPENGFGRTNNIFLERTGFKHAGDIVFTFGEGDIDLDIPRTIEKDVERYLALTATILRGSGL
jgi:hypothetical protein